MNGPGHKTSTDLRPSAAPGPRPAVPRSDEGARAPVVDGRAPDGAEPRVGWSALAPGDAVIGYLAAWETDGGAAATAAIHAAVDERDVRLLEIVRERATRVPSLERPGLSCALARIARGEARALVVSDVRHLCRSTIDLGSLVRWFADARATLIALDLGVDTTTPRGQAVAEAMITLADWESDRIARRTRNGLAQARARGRPVGPPALTDAPALRERVAAMRAANMTLQMIADALNAEGVPTLRGGVRWRPSSVQSVLGYRRPRKVR